MSTVTSSGSHIATLMYTKEFDKNGYRYHKLRKAFSKFYLRHYELIEKYHVSQKKSISNPEISRNSVYKFKKIIGNPNFSDLFNLFYRCKNSGHNLDIMRQTACIGLNPNMNDSCAALFSCTAVVQASDSLTASMFKTFKYLVEA